MEDKEILKWLNDNMNKYDLFYFKDNTEDDNIIDCFYKEDDRLFCIYYRDTIQSCIDENMGISN